MLCSLHVSLGPLVFNVRSLPHKVSFEVTDTGSSILVFHCLFQFVFNISVFFYSLFFVCHWISFVFLHYERCICSSAPILLVIFLGELSGIGTGFVTRC